jgi:hypothetical protein
MYKKIIEAMACIMMLILGLPSHPVSAQEISGRDIMVLAYERPDGDDRRSVLTMTLINKRGSQRVRQVESFSRDYGRDRKSVMVFNEPADVRGTAYLSWEYDEPDREDDKWLYMPALKKVRRISGSSRNEYFMGTDFTYDDIGKRRVNKDIHTLLGEEQAMEHDCWKVESIPVDPQDLYKSRTLWVSKTAHMVVKAEYFDKDGLVKVYRALDLRQHEGFWTLFRSEMDNVSRTHKTVMNMESMQYDTGLGDELFQVSAIQRGRIR